MGEKDSDAGADHGDMPPHTFTSSAAVRFLYLLTGLAAAGVIAWTGLAGAGQGADPECRGNAPHKICPKLTPPDGGVVSEAVLVEAGVPDSVVAIAFRVNGAPLAPDDVEAPYQVRWDTTALSNGAHELSATATDAEGKSSTRVHEVTVSNEVASPPGDTTDPTVSVTNPSAGATVAGQVSVAAAASDDVGVAGVQFKLDGANLGAEDTSAPYAVTWDTSKATNAQHTLSAVARDAAGNSSSASITVTVSNGSTGDLWSPSGSPLRWAAPGYDGSGDPRDSRNYPGFVVVDAPQSGGSLNLDDSKDYFVKLGHPKWSSVSSGRSSLRIGGGRHVVIVGGAITFTQTNSSDDQICLMIDGGNSSGIVHVEGVDMKCVNGVTVRTPRVVQLENVRIWAHSSSTSTLHPDVIQVWRGHRSAGIRLHRFTAYSNFTYLSDLTDTATPYGVNAPVYWELHDIDLHPINGAGLNNWMGQPQNAVFRGSNLWLETSVDSTGSRRDLGDQLRQFGTQYSPQHAGYQIFDANNNLLYTQQPGIASGAPGDIGRIRGHRLRYLSTSLHPGLTGIEWRAQLPSTADGADANGNFVPSSLVGTGYVPSGYR